MAVRSTRSINVQFTGDINLADEFDANANAGSPGVSEFKSFTTGFTALTIPSGTVKAVTIIPPVDNTLGVTLKGVTGDTGIILSPSEPTSIALGVTSTIGLTIAAGPILIRLIWS